MDDDNDGRIDMEESSEFIKEELSQANGQSRQTRFHAGDEDGQITVHDLWVAFNDSPIAQWDTDQIITWLSDCAGGEKYASLFAEKQVTGLYLPLIACNKDHFIRRFFGHSAILSEDKRRIMLKAQDTVLFGPCSPKGHHWIKDILLASAAVVASICLIVARRQRQVYASEMERLSTNIELLTSAEKDLEDLNKRLHQEEMKRQKLAEEKQAEETMKQELVQTIDSIRSESEELKQKSLDSEAVAERLQNTESELTRVRARLKAAEKQLSESSTGSRSSPAPGQVPQELIDLLQETYRREIITYNQRKADAELHFTNAKKYLDKVKQKKNSVLGNFRLAHGSAMDEVDVKMNEARLALEAVREVLREMRQRWHLIEIACDFPFTTTTENSRVGMKRESSSASLTSLASTANPSLANVASAQL